MASTAARNLVEIGRTARGLDQNEGNRTSNVNFFVLGAVPQRAEAAQSDMKRAEPVQAEPQRAIETPVTAIETAPASQQPVVALQ